MSDTDRTTVDETVTAAQRHQLCDQVGSTCSQVSRQW